MGVQSVSLHLATLPATEPFWSEVVAKMKSLMLGMTPPGDHLVEWCKNKEYDRFTDHVCYHLPRDMKMLKEKGTNTSHPVTAYFCGNPDIDWSGEKFQGKPTHDVCSMTVGSAYKPGGVCDSAKDIIMSLAEMATTAMKEGNPMAAGGDPRNINAGLMDCILDIQDCNIHMCHHCPGRCSGQVATSGLSAAETLEAEGSDALVEGSDTLGASAFADRLHASLLASTVYTSRFGVADSGDAPAGKHIKDVVQSVLDL